MKISLAPIDFYWTKSVVNSFYQKVCQSEVDTVYLGETVCFKRKELVLNDWIDIALQLQEAGKKVVFSSLTLNSMASELSQLNKIAGLDFEFEANDISAVQAAMNIDKPFICGPTLNIYSAESLQSFKKLGANHWVAPYEATGRQIKQITNENLMTSEVFSYGFIPLAWSARCYTARHLGLSKDQCKLACIDYPKGIAVLSQEGQPVFNLNGIQTQSGQIQNYLSIVDKLQQAKVNQIRLSMDSIEALDNVGLFKKAIHGQSQMIAQDSSCNGYWFEKEGMATVQP